MFGFKLISGMYLLFTCDKKHYAQYMHHVSSSSQYRNLFRAYSGNDPSYEYQSHKTVI